MTDNPKALLRRLFDRAVAVADPAQSLAAHLPPRPEGRIIVIGAGKASARMAEAVEAEWGPCEGLVLTRYGHARPCAGVQIVEAAHPVPDDAGMRATRRMLDILRGLGPNDFVLALISGGASSLLVQPAGDITLAEKQAINQALLASGAPIGQMNAVRKHLSSVKGGQLAAAAYPARMLALLISDVPGDDPAMIGSGPTVGDADTPGAALAILERYAIDVPPSVRAVLNGASGVVPPGDARLARVQTQIYAAPSHSLAAAADLARDAGCVPRIIGDALEGEARDVAALHAKDALAAQSAMAPGDAPLVLLSGGELTVTRRGAGIGGPNAEYALALAIALDSVPGIHAIACDTDGVDGAAEVAGAIIGPDTLRDASALGLDPIAALERNDAHTFFRALGAQVVTGPTLTNVNDFRATWVQPLVPRSI
ncbi:glycerate kinase type-2 family protein [Roseovarius arcticus]|uniref:glycerate kinase type-2 family protein n=1 Tax=Roseovarius arcticus TaxID=2547404 RepID=UPI001110F148|nr:glycerate kinase [Roseovarius arcticus]